ncbi:hypothetical protein AALP_AA1G281800 [Arabis alpina]|uniref:Uncharacterized protein n=1 Tax=Arabis alpina TaxID=50452 RepID=A0A087HR64_ARAAL|nr:hypothetical protein AALP_AA1G281800 [Arabis alpina]
MIMRQHWNTEKITQDQDGLLFQISVNSDKLAVEFADRVTETIPASYIEFSQRLIKEYHRREGFDFDNAKNILESARFTSDV